MLSNMDATARCIAEFEQTLFSVIHDWQYWFGILAMEKLLIEENTIYIWKTTKWPIKWK